MPGMDQSGLPADAVISLSTTPVVSGVAAKPRAPANAAPRSAPAARQSERLALPAAAPEISIPIRPDGARKAAWASDHCGLPPRWQARLMIGLKPPDMA